MNRQFMLFIYSLSAELVINYQTETENKSNRNRKENRNKTTGNNNSDTNFTLFFLLPLIKFVDHRALITI